MQFLSESALSDVQLVIKLRANQALGGKKVPGVGVIKIPSSLPIYKLICCENVKKVE